MNLMSRQILLALLLSTALLSARDPETAADSDRSRFLAVVEAHFAAWDADHDGSLSVAEINQRVADPAVRGEAAAAIAALKRAARSQKTGQAAFTLPQLTSMAGPGPAKSGGPDLPAMFAGGVKRIEQAPRELFSPEGPSIQTIRQGRMGNCFSLAPLAALAHLRPNYIREKMILPQQDGTFLVNLGKEAWPVTKPTDAEIALCSSNVGGGLWVNVYEKAAGEARNAQKPADQRQATGLDALARGGSAGTQLAFITGHGMYRVSCSFAKKKALPKEDYDKHMAELRAALTSATREKRLMTCGTLKTKIPGITPNHAYAILGYDAATDRIRLWNPHGDTRSVKGEPGPANGYPMEHGVFEMPLTVFVKEFAGTAYEILPGTDKPTAGE